MLDDFSAEDFARLRDGTHDFGLRGPDGKIMGVHLHLSGARSKVRRAQFDLWSGPWNIKPDSLGPFMERYTKYWDRQERQMRNQMYIPQGKSTFSLSALRTDIGQWLKDAALFICDAENLYPVSTIFEQATR